MLGLCCSVDFSVFTVIGGHSPAAARAPRCRGFSCCGALGSKACGLQQPSPWAPQSWLPSPGAQAHHCGTRASLLRCVQESSRIRGGTRVFCNGRRLSTRAIRDALSFVLLRKVFKNNWNTYLEHFLIMLENSVQRWYFYRWYSYKTNISGFYKINCLNDFW